MRKSPFLNALIAALYIIVIVFVIDSVTSITALQQTILIPMVMLSLFVLSAAIMGFLFMYEPFNLFIENRKQEALLFFAKIVGTFALLTALFLGTLLYVTLP